MSVIYTSLGEVVGLGAYCKANIMAARSSVDMTLDPIDNRACIATWQVIGHYSRTT